MRVLVTGATGFIGQALVYSLANDGLQVCITGRSRPQYLEKNVTWHLYPNDVSGWKSLLAGVDTVYHLAWSTVPTSSNANPTGDVTDNVLPSLALMDAAKDVGANIVFASSGGTVYGLLKEPRATEDHTTTPISAYGVSKLSTERYLNFYGVNYGLRSVAVRISNPYGVSRRSAHIFGSVSAFANAALQRKTITVFGDGSVVRDYIFIDDVIEGLRAAANLMSQPSNSPSKVAEIVNIGTGVGTSINEVIRVIESVIGRQLEIEYVSTRQFDVPYSVLDVRRAGKLMSWEPTTKFADGVARTIRLLKDLHGLG